MKSGEQGALIGTCCNGSGNLCICERGWELIQHIWLLELYGYLLGEGLGGGLTYQQRIKRGRHPPNCHHREHIDGHYPRQCGHPDC